MKEMDDIEQLFSSTFEGAEMTPPIEAKEQIDKALFATGSTGRGGSYWWILVLVIGLLGGTSAIILFTTSTDANPSIAQTDVSDESIGTEPSTETQVNNNNNNNEQGIETDRALEDEKTTQGMNGGETDRESGSENGEANSKNDFGDRNFIPSNGEGKSTQSAAIDTENDKEITGVQMAGGNSSSILGQSSGDGKSPSFGPVSSNQTSSGKQKQGDDASASSSPKSNNFKEGSSSSALTDNTSSDSMTDVGDGAMGTNDNSGEQEGDELTLQLNTNPVSLLSVGSDLKTLEERTQPKPINTGKSNKLSLALYSGGSYGFNSLRSTDTVAYTVNMRESMGYYAGLEVIYPISARFSLSGGVDYGQYKAELYDEISTIDSVSVPDSWSLVWIDSTQTYDSIFVPGYTEGVTTTELLSGYIKQLSIGVPIYLHYSASIGTRMSLNLGVGARFSYMKYTTVQPEVNLPYPDYKQFGVNIQFRPELVYHFNKIGVGVYGKLEYDLMQGMEWSNLNRRRWGVGAGISLRYKL